LYSSGEFVILVDEGSREVMSVAKEKWSVLAIEARPNMNEHCLFALGVSSFLCRL
jgi:hypothetical protein